MTIKQLLEGIDNLITREDSDASKKAWQKRQRGNDWEPKMRTVKPKPKIDLRQKSRRNFKKRVSIIRDEMDNIGIYGGVIFSGKHSNFGDSTKNIYKFQEWVNTTFDKDVPFRRAHQNNLRIVPQGVKPSSLTRKQFHLKAQKALDGKNPTLLRRLIKMWIGSNKRKYNYNSTLYGNVGGRKIKKIGYRYTPIDD